MSTPEVINIAEKLSAFSDYFNPRIVGSYNGNDLRLAKVKGEFTWHSHADTDELFLVVSGTLKIAFREGVRELAAGEMLIVPRGVEHCPSADAECAVLVIDREGEPNTGANPSHLTRAELERI